MFKNRLIRLLLALNTLVIGAWVGWWLYQRGEPQRRADEELTQLARRSEEMGALSAHDFERLMRLGRKAKEDGRYTDQDLEEVLSMPEKVTTPGPPKENAVIFTLGMLREPKEFTPKQKEEVARFLAQQYSTVGSKGSLSAALAATFAVKFGMPGGREALVRFSQSPDRVIARQASEALRNSDKP